MMKWLTVAFCLVALLGGYAPASTLPPVRGASSIAPEIASTDIAFTRLPAPPTVTTNNATNVTNNSARLTGNLTSMGTATAVIVFFEYGENISDGNISTTEAEVMTGIGPFSASIANLSPGTTYYFRANAVGDGTANGTDMSLKTLVPPAVITNNATDNTTNSATLNGNLTSLGTATTVYVSFEWGTTTGYGNNTTAQPMTGIGVFSASLTSLIPATIYHFRTVADGGVHGIATGNDTAFTTTPIAPVIVTLSANVTANSAFVTGNLTSMGLATQVNVFFEYGTDTSYGSFSTNQTMTSPGIFSANLTGLSWGARYYFRAKADGGVYGTATGAEMSFDISQPLPGVITSAATSITTKSAILNGDLTSLGDATTVYVSFQYGENITYGSITTAEAMTGRGAFSANISGLSPNTTYHFRAKAVGYDTVFGGDKTFRTLAPPTVITNNATGIIHNYAILSGNLTSLGSANQVNVFFEWGEGISYGNMTAMVTVGTTGQFSANVTGLSPNTTYHFRAKAVGDGTATGADMTLTTLPPIPPAVTTSNVNSVATDSANVSGNLTSLGDAPTVDVFFECGLTTSYGSNTTPVSVSTTGLFSANITGLTPWTTYHFRAKADAGVYGRATGASMNFTTAVIPPEVTTVNATVAITSANVSGNLTSLGTATAVNVSFEYGLTTSYGSNTNVQPMMGIGVFSANITGLAPNTTYHFRAKADGGVHGVAYGASMNFTTLTAIAPVVDTLPATSVTSNAATLGGNLTSLGAAATANVSFEYGLTTSYGSNTTVQPMTGIGTFSAGITGLSSNTTYHFRAKADAGLHGVAYGASMNFTTTTVLPPTPPTVSVAGGGSAGSVPVLEFTGKDGNKTGGAISPSGEVWSDIKAYSTDSRLIVTLPVGTLALNKEGRPLRSLGMSPEESAPLPPNRASMFGSAYDFQPDGATFVPSITLVWSYNPDDIPKGVNEKDLLVGFWDEKAGSWTMLEGGVVDTVAHSISVPVSHFSKYAIFYYKPAAFQVSSLGIFPAEAIAGETVSISALVSNTGGTAGSYQLVLKINGIVQATRDIAVNAGVSQEVSFTVASDVADRYYLDLNGTGGYFTLNERVVPQPPAPEPATFTISQPLVIPDKVSVGENVTVSAVVTNSGGTAGTYAVVMTINGVREARKDVTVDAGASQRVSFIVTKNTLGTYQVNVNSLASSFSVEGKAISNWWLLVIAAAVLVVLAGSAIYLLARRRKQGKSASDYNEQGLVNHKHGEYDASIANFTKAIKLDPKSTVFYLNRGLAYVERGEYNKAIVDYTQAITVDPNCIEAYYDRAVVYKLLGRKAEAIADFERIIKLQSDPKLSEKAKQELEELRKSG
ncbi:MAG: tetratricopeptide repeat protein [Chloroflexota bacterium]